MFLETILDSKPKVKILRVLIDGRTAFSMYDIKKLSGLSIGAVHKVVTSLSKEGIVFEKKGKGKQRFYQINIDNKYSKNIINLFEDEKSERRFIPVHIWNKLESLCSEVKNKFSIKGIILFGSLARGEFRMSSDIDMLIITHDNFKEEIMVRKLCRKKFNKNRVNPIFLSEKELNKYEEKKSDFYINILKEGLRLV